MRLTRRQLFAGIAGIFGAKALPMKTPKERIVRVLAQKASTEESPFIDEETPWIDWGKP